MGESRVDGPESPAVKSAEEMAGRFHGELMAQMPDWKARLTHDPSSLPQLERDVHASFARGADLVVTGLLAMVMKQPAFEQAAEATRRGFRHGLGKGRTRNIRFRLLGGLVIWLSSLYCAPRRTLFRAHPADATGLYVELAQFGFGKGCSPGLESCVARAAAWSPSFELATRELERGGVTLDVKTVSRITRQCGEGLLALRTHEIQALREGTLPTGDELHGQRVSVQIDGGRTRIRSELREKPAEAEVLDANGLPTEDPPGRSKTVARKTFDADWREPKVMTIFVHDEHGKMDRQFQATIDGTLQGPDALAEMVATHLHRLGGAKAASITFVSDGAAWIWDRLGEIIRRAGLQDVAIHEVLDCCHATHHISRALAALGLGEKERLPLYREHRTLLRNGHWRRVVAELEELAAAREDCVGMQTEIAYLRKHGAAGRLAYPRFRALGIPIGSGAIESTIRRVVNNRLKGNSIYWKECNAESMLQVRAQIVSNRWDARLSAMRLHEKRHGRRAWNWQPQPYSKSERAKESTA